MFCCVRPEHDPGTRDSEYHPSDPSLLLPELEFSTPSLSEHMLVIRQALASIKDSQDKHEQSLRGTLQQELQVFKASLASFIQSSKDESLGSENGIKESLEVDAVDPAQKLAKVEADTVVSPDAIGICMLEVAMDGECDASRHELRQENKHASGEKMVGETFKSETRDDRCYNGANDVQVKETSGFLPSQTLPTQRWNQFLHDVEDFDCSSMYNQCLERKLAEQSVWHKIFQYFQYDRLVYHRMPTNWAARITARPEFSFIQTMLILSNTCLMGYEADAAIQAVLQDPNGQVPEWFDTFNNFFNVLFAVELLFRMAGLGSWFFVAPGEWAWNTFDAFLVCASLMATMLHGINLTFVRSLRIFRVVRVARVIRVLRFFRQLRQMLFAILACLSSLAWAFVFLALIMFMFSMLFLQGVVMSVEDLQQTSAENEQRLVEIQRWFGSLGTSMLSLLAAVTGGEDWMIIRQPLADAGGLYSAAFILYMLFVTVGVMNVLTGVFLCSAEEFIDLDLIVQREQMKVETFIEQMLQLFLELDLHHEGEIDWPTFRLALSQEQVRAYLRSLHLDPVHIHLIFDLMDEQRTGKISIQDLVMGMVRMKGEAKAVDARIILREISMLPQLFNQIMATQKIAHLDRLHTSRV